MTEKTSELKVCPVCRKEHSPFCCPFCGNPLVLVRNESWDHPDQSCVIEDFFFYEIDDHAEELWNTRAKPPAPPEPPSKDIVPPKLQAGYEDMDLYDGHGKP